MRCLYVLVSLCLVLVLVQCSDVPTAATTDDTEEQIAAKGENGAAIIRGMSDWEGFYFVDTDRNLLAVAYSSDDFAEPDLATYGFNCDLPDHDVEAQLMLVENPSGGGMVRFQGSTAVAIYHYTSGWPLPMPDGGFNCPEDQLVAHGVIDQYIRKTTNVFFATTRTTSMGLSGKGMIENALGPGEVYLHMNAEYMYNAGDVRLGIFESLPRIANIRLTPDPRN